jgi:hypothetical protein
MAVDIPDAVNATQPNWRFCNQCHSLFWNGDPHGSKGICIGAPPGIEGHRAQGWDFYLLSDPENGIP